MTLKIEYIRLKNLVSIMAGMGKEEIEIDFTKGRNEKILLIGNNGSGKSVLISSLTPYKDTNDIRKVKPLPGKEGLKEIRYNYNGDIYTIVHYYKDNGDKSYIQKNGEELNPAGGVRTCKEIIEKELDISPDYFAVGRLGSNVSNFIDYTSTERKKYINKFIPSIDEYLDAFNIVNEKHRDLTKDLKTTETKLEKYKSLDELNEDRVTLQSNIDNLTTDITRSEVEKTNLEKEQKDLSIEASRLQGQIGEEFEEGSFTEHYMGLETKQEKLYDELVEYKDKYPKLFETESIKEDIAKRLPGLQVKIENGSYKVDALTEEIQEARTRVQDLNVDSRSKQKRIDSYSLSNVEELEKDLEELQEEVAVKEKSISALREEHGDQFVNYSKDLIDEYIRSRVATALSTLRDKFDTFLSTKSGDPYLGLEKYGDNVEDLKSKLTSMSSELDSLRVKAEGLEEDLTKVNQQQGILVMVAESEHQDHIEECPFVAEAMELTSGGTIEEVQEILEQTYKEIEKLEDDLQDLNLYLQTRKEFSTLVLDQGYEKNKDRLECLGLTREDVERLFTASSFLYQDYEVLLDEVFRRHNLLVIEKTTLTEKVENLTEKLENNSRFQETIQDYEETIKKNEEKIQDLGKTISSKEKELNDLEKELKRSKATKIVLEKIQKLLTSIDKGEEELESLDLIQEEMITVEGREKEIKGLLKEISTTLETRTYDRDKLRDQVEDINRAYYTVESSLTKLDQINEVLDYFTSIKSVLDVKEGIPLIFTDLYTDAIAERTNELLEIAYGDDFSIEFEITARDFNIIVNKGDGSSLADISEASQGEIAMTNTSLSLAMMANVTSGYNILYLDEVDATLDDNNRRNFLDVLDRQIEILGSDQVFIISHNNEFYSSNIDLILLDGYESKIDISDPVLMDNKEILYIN